MLPDASADELVFEKHYAREVCQVEVVGPRPRPLADVPYTPRPGNLSGRRARVHERGPRHLKFRAFTLDLGRGMWGEHSALCSLGAAHAEGCVLRCLWG